MQCGRNLISWCRPSGARFLFIGLTPDLRPGLSYAAPAGLEWGGAFCVFPTGNAGRTLFRRGTHRRRRSQNPQISAAGERAGMLRLRSEDRCALLSAALSMTAQELDDGGPMDLGRRTLRLRSGQAAEGGCPHMSWGPSGSFSDRIGLLEETTGAEISSAMPLPQKSCIFHRNRSNMTYGADSSQFGPVPPSKLPDLQFRLCKTT